MKMFPPDFLWGAVTSAYQVEGGNKNDWSELASRRSGWPDAGKACDHYRLFKEDFDLAKSLGHNAHRFSIEWSRIEPEEGKFNEEEFKHYEEVIRALKERGFEPFVTLWHFTLPIWFAKKGGWLNKDSARYFERYVAKVAETYKHLGIKFWITINEPEIYTLNSYFRGKWLPNRRNPFFCCRVTKNLIRAHKRAYGVIKKSVPYAEVGLVKNNSYFEPYGSNPWNKILSSLANNIWNHYFLRRVRGSYDFIGLNYYFHNRVNWKFNQNENKSISDIGCEIYPEGLYRVLMDLKRYKKPIYITGNGLADAKDVKRAKFIENHLRAASQAMKDGVDLKGYFYWSLMDNFEWNKGFAPRFGLVEIDYKTFRRSVRSSAMEYKKIIENRLVEV
ncbi:hypothetical protein A3H53_01170 [Candidatus Nomurabacteria bacterium RIFCSPLOWO2_02_FULL_40_10]|uniref:Beta-glucosidase n=1 Tax=Candidatus Nomurabacteria bacterium RIFCSPLOWO2_02_FULL_40_10 TaxID=1801786 RepID=A0A1F6XWU9_9BACT|nr:MAG: hypothetical protein A3H53_01170 [Candidatus Nomurabacteria bacterium RIFCSPLOWO2_02_FULL_40_10]